MKNKFTKFSFFVIVLVLIVVLSFTYISTRLSKKVSFLNEKAAATTEILFQILNVQRAILDYDNLISQFLLHENSDSYSDLDVQTKLIRRSIAQLRVQSFNQFIKLDVIDSLSNYTEKRIEINNDLLLIRKEKGVQEAIIYSDHSLLANYKIKTRAIINQLENLESKELQNYLAVKEKAVMRFNLILLSILVILIFLGIIILIQLKKANRQKKNEIDNTKYVEKILSSISDSVITTDTDFKVKSWNTAAERLYGFLQEKTKGLDIADAVRSLEDRDVINQIRHEMQTKGSWNGEVKHLNADGQEIILQSYRSALKDSDGLVTGYVSSNRDITQKKISDQLLIRFNQELAEKVKEKTKEIKENKEKLEASEKNLRQVLNSSADIYYVIDRNYNIILINSIAEKQLTESWKKPVLLGGNIHELIPSELGEPIIENFEKVFNGERIEYELQLHNKKLPEWVFVSYSPVTDENGKITGAYVVIKDITNRKKAETELTLTKESYFALMNNVDGIVWEADAKTFDFSFVSKQAERLLGYPVEQWLNEPGFWANHIYEEDRSRAVDYCVQCTFEKKTHEFEYRMVADDGRIVWLRDIVTVQIENEQPVKLTGLMVDITEAKKAEKAIRQSEEKYRSLIEQASEPIIIYSLDGTIHEFNKTACDMSGYSPDEFSKLRLNDILIGDIVINKENQDSILDGNTITINRQVRKKDGRILDMELITKLIEDNKILAFGRDVTERKRIADAIKKEKELSDSIINSLPGIFYIFDQIPKLVRWNKRFEVISGYNETELITKTPMKLFHEDDQLLMKKTIDQTFKSGYGETEARLITKEGKAVPFILTGIVIEYEGKPCILGTGIDIEERKSAETALAESESYLRTIIQAEPECVKLLDKNGNLEDMNDAGLQMIEADSLEQVKGYSVVNIVSEPYRNDFNNLTKNVFKGKSGKLEFEITGLKGSKRWLETHATPLKNAEGKIISLLGVTRDITNNKIAEKTIIKEKELSESIINNLPDIFYLFDKEGKILRWNKNFEKVLGYNKKEITGITPFDLFESSVRETLLEKVKEIIETGKIEFEGSFLTKSRKKIPYFFKGWKVHYEGNSCIIGIGVDMTNKIKAEELLQKSYEDIRRLASHLEQVREEERIAIAREIHDELGQQLTVLKMDISWLDSRLTVKEDPVQKKMDDLLATIDNTVKTVRRISSELRPSILDDLGLITALEWHAQEFEERSGIKTKFTSEVGELKFPVNKSTSIYRIFQESLTNIARHAKANSVSVKIKILKNEFIMTIQDDGNGFDPTVIGIKKTLGILGMRERANILGGEYMIESKKNKGTLTKVRIPVNNET